MPMKKLDCQMLTEMYSDSFHQENPIVQVQSAYLCGKSGEQPK